MERGDYHRLAVSADNPERALTPVYMEHPEHFDVFQCVYSLFILNM